MDEPPHGQSSFPELTLGTITDRGVAFALILMDADAHRRICLHAKPGELLENLLAACFWESEGEGKYCVIETALSTLADVHEWLAGKGVEVRPRAVPYVRRTNNQVSAELEAIIRDLLARGWTKTDIARVLRVNRRVVIRVGREATRSDNQVRHPDL